MRGRIAADPGIPDAEPWDPTVAELAFMAATGRRPEPEDNLAPARGCLLGVLLGALAWLALWAVTRP